MAVKKPLCLYSGEIKELQTGDALPGIPGVVDLSSVTEDYALSVGETAIISCSGATSVPLHVAVAGYKYELSIFCTSLVDSSNGDWVQLNPNNTTYSGQFFWNRLYQYNGGYSGGDTGTNDYFIVGAGLLRNSETHLYTATGGKSWQCVMGKAFTGNTNTRVMIMDGVWDDTTTVWSSLGTIVFPVAWTGMVVIKRII